MRHIYVIYMPQREEYIRDVFKKTGININPIFFPAVNSASLPRLSTLYKTGYLGAKFLKKKLAFEGFPNMDLDLFEDNKDNTKYINSSIKGVLALQLSYMLVFDHFMTNNPKAKHCYVFEDDILYINNWHSRLNRIIKVELPKDFDIVNMGRCYDLCNKNKYYSKNLVTSTSPLCTHSCGYSVRLMQYVINNALPLNDPCDIMLRKVYNGPKFKGFSVSPPIFFQNKDFESLLGNPRVMPECA